MTTVVTPRYFKIKTLSGFGGYSLDEEVNETVGEIINEGNVIHEISQSSSFDKHNPNPRLTVMIVYFRP